MKLTMNDMDHPRFWALQSASERIVRESVGDRFIETMSDRESKAVADAVEALTKAKLLAVRRERAEIS